MISEISFIKNYPSFWDEFTPNAKDLITEINGQGDNFGYFSPVDIDEAQYRSINNMLAYKRFELLYQGVESEINSIFEQVLPTIRLLPRTNIESYSIKDKSNIKAITQISSNLISFYSKKELKFHPLFRGCSFLSDSQGDLYYDSTLVELKAGQRNFIVEDIRQLLVYILLNFLSKHYELRRVELLNPRTGQYFEMSLDIFIKRTSILSLEDLSIEFSNYLFTLSNIRE